MQPPLRLVAFEFRKWLSGGRSRPILVAAKDASGRQYVIVLKTRRPAVPYGAGHYGGTSLACELICAVLARAAEIPVPDYAIVDIPAALAAAVPDSDARLLLQNNPGDNFGSVFVDGLALWQERDRAASSELMDFFEQAVQFDASLVNGDRSAEKSNVIWRGTRAYLIDHSLALPIFLWGEGAETTNMMLPEQSVRRHASFASLVNHGKGFATVLEKWPELLTPANLATLRSWIPATWEHQAGHLNRVFGYLGLCGERAVQVTAELRRILR